MLSLSIDRHPLKSHRSPLCCCCIHRWESFLQCLIFYRSKAFTCCIARHEVCPHQLFMTLQMRWQGQDEEGHPLFIVHIGRLCNECQSHELAQQAADAIISQVLPCSQEGTLYSFRRSREEGAIVQAHKGFMRVYSAKCGIFVALAFLSEKPSCL